MSGYCMKKRFVLTILVVNLFLTTWCRSMPTASDNTYSTSSASNCTIDAVVLTAGKDFLAFERSIQSSLKHFLDVRNYYIITPHPAELIKKFTAKPWYSSRIKIVGEDTFPFIWNNISDVMIQSVQDAGVYPLDGGKSVFERTVYGRVGWFLQQLLKLYAGKVYGLGDYILLDSDIIWFKDIRFVAQCNATTRSYFYASSSQYHAPYMATLGRISGVGPTETSVHRSGIVHHMVIVKNVLDDLMSVSEHLHGGLPFWQVLLNVSAREMTCRAPKTNICGAGSTLSEYELYFNFARAKHPVPAAFDRQITADMAQGYDYVGYHNYAKRRYNELPGVDCDFLCQNVSLPFNSTCSWRGYEELEERHLKLKEREPTTMIALRNVTDYFKNCACYMIMNQSGP